MVGHNCPSCRQLGKKLSSQQKQVNEEGSGGNSKSGECFIKLLLLHSTPRPSQILQLNWKSLHRVGWGTWLTSLGSNNVHICGRLQKNCQPAYILKTEVLEVHTLPNRRYVWLFEDLALPNESDISMPAERLRYIGSFKPVTRVRPFLAAGVERLRQCHCAGSRCGDKFQFYGFLVP